MQAEILFIPSTSAPAPAPLRADLNVAVVPAADSAGFFVALHEGLFAARGLLAVQYSFDADEWLVLAAAGVPPCPSRSGLAIGAG